MDSWYLLEEPEEYELTAEDLALINMLDVLNEIAEFGSATVSVDFSGWTLTHGNGMKGKI